MCNHYHNPVWEHFQLPKRSLMLVFSYSSFLPLTTGGHQYAFCLYRFAFSRYIHEVIQYVFYIFQLAWYLWVSSLFLSCISSSSFFFFIAKEYSIVQAHLIDIWIVSGLLLLQIMLLWIFTYMSLCKYMFSFLLARFLTARLPMEMVGLT